MVSTISTCFAQIQAVKGWAANHSKMHHEFQEDSLFQLAAVKNLRSRSLVENFKNTKISRFWLGARLASMCTELNGIKVDRLASDFFKIEDLSSRAEKIRSLQNCVVILNNNDIGIDEALEVFPEFVENCPSTIFLVWDFDNHHWLQLSQSLAAYADMYFPAHSENLYFLTRLNWNLAGPVPCGTIQWTREYLTQSLPNMLQTQRSDQPLGMHFYYSQFPFRNRSVVTLRQHFSSVDFSNAQFHKRNDDDRFQEWCNHKSHWVIPVLNDVPIRIFDALSTGGIPIVPSSLKYLSPVSQIPQEWIIFYEADELLSPERVVQRANAAFDRGGALGIVDRHRFALQNHHGENSLRSILSFAENRFGFQLGG